MVQIYEKYSTPQCNFG